MQFDSRCVGEVVLKLAPEDVRASAWSLVREVLGKDDSREGKCRKVYDDIKNLGTFDSLGEAAVYDLLQAGEIGRAVDLCSEVMNWGLESGWKSLSAVKACTWTLIVAGLREGAEALLTEAGALGTATGLRSILAYYCPRSGALGRPESKQRE